MNTTVEAIAKGEKAPSPVAKLSTYLDKFKPQIRLALPTHLNPDRMCRITLSECSRNPKLLECDPISVLSCVLQSSAQGLEIGVGGQAYMVPYWDKTRRKLIATYMPGWKGLLDLVNHSGRASAWTGAVYEGDQFRTTFGDRPSIDHEPADRARAGRSMVRVYAVGRVRGAEWPTIDVWHMDDIWAHRDKYNKVGDSHYSFSHPEMYARKVPLLQVLKYLPQSIELQKAIASAHAADTGDVLDGLTSVLDDAGIDPDTGEITGDPKGSSVRTVTPTTDATPRDGPKPKSYAELSDLMQKAAGPDQRALLLDEAREYLPAEQLADLRKLADRHGGTK